MDQNNIILILLLIAVLVAFYAIYLAMENSKKLKKINLEMLDIVKLVQESSNLNRDTIVHPNPEVPTQLPDDNLSGYPTLDEVKEFNDAMRPCADFLDEALKDQIDNLGNMNEEELLRLEKEIEDDNVEDDNVEGDNVEGDNVEGDNVEGDDVEGDNVEGDDVEGDDVEGDDVEGDNVEGDDVEGDDVEGDDVEGKSSSSSEVSFPVLSELEEGSLNDLNCEELREICKREELRTRGRKAELVERILKKKEALS